MAALLPRNLETWALAVTDFSCGSRPCIPILDDYWVEDWLSQSINGR